MPNFNTPDSTGTYDPPDALDEFLLIVVGGEGADSAAQGGDGGYVELVFAPASGETFTYYVGENPRDDTDGQPVLGGRSPLADAGDGRGVGTSDYYGGGGGAVSALQRDSDGAFIAIGEGGGGGGDKTGTVSVDVQYGGGGGSRGGLGGANGAEDAQGTGEGGDGGDGAVTGTPTPGQDGGTTAITSATQVTETTVDAPTPRVEIIDTPRNLTIATRGYSETDVDIRIDADNAESWTLHRATTSGFTPDSGNQIASFGSGGQHDYTDTGVSPGTTYYYVAEATNPAGTTQTAELTQSTPLRASTNVTVANITDTTADVSWQDNTTGNDGYRVLASRDGGSTYTTVADNLAAGATSETITGLLNGEQYTFAVEAYTADVTARALEVA